MARPVEAGDRRPLPSMKRLVAMLLFVLGPVLVWGTPELTDTRGWLHLNGYTHHFDAPGANDNIFGVGFTWYDRRHGSPLAAWEGDVFRDSGRKLSAYVGRSWTFPLGDRIGAGLSAAVMYHHNFARQNRWRVLPVGFPFLEARSGSLKLRAYYVPPFRSRHDQQIAFQVHMPVWR